MANPQQRMTASDAMLQAGKCARKNRIDQAIETYRAILQSVPDHRAAALGLARLEIRTGRADAWVHRLQSAPLDDPEWRQLLGDAFWLIGRIDEALSCYRLPKPEPRDSGGLASTSPGREGNQVRILRPGGQRRPFLVFIRSGVPLITRFYSWKTTSTWLSRISTNSSGSFRETISSSPKRR
jgi:hypothetical protein